jgi:hypothetical protein
MGEPNARLQQDATTDPLGSRSTIEALTLCSTMQHQVGLFEASKTLITLTTAKKAFLATVSNPPPSLAASSHQAAAKITPYTGPETETILQAVATRPRSRSIAQNGSMHARRPSGSSLSGPPPLNGQGHARRESTGHGRQGSFSSAQLSPEHEFALS